MTFGRSTCRLEAGHGLEERAIVLSQSYVDPIHGQVLDIFLQCGRQNQRFIYLVDTV